jgi:hypothetical protein
MWIFNGVGSRLPSGAFSDLETAVEWIRDNSLTGILTEYPLDQGVYQWALGNGYYRPKGKEDAGFIGRFSSAHQRHYHFEEGLANHALPKT